VKSVRGKLRLSRFNLGWVGRQTTARTHANEKTKRLLQIGKKGGKPETIGDLPRRRKQSTPEGGLKDTALDIRCEKKLQRNVLRLAIELIASREGLHLKLY